MAISTDNPGNAFLNSIWIVPDIGTRLERELGSTTANAFRTVRSYVRIFGGEMICVGHPDSCPLIIQMHDARDPYDKQIIQAFTASRELGGGAEFWTK